MAPDSFIWSAAGRPFAPIHLAPPPPAHRPELSLPAPSRHRSVLVSWRSDFLRFVSLLTGGPLTEPVKVIRFRPFGKRQSSLLWHKYFN
jgi:hypothetical protein